MTTPPGAPVTEPEPTALVVALSSDDVSLVLDLSDRALPAVVHWGGRLEGLEARDLAAIVDTGVALNGMNDIDVPRRLAVLPEQHRAWAGRPGLQGSRGGRNWSTRFTVDRVTLDGEPLLESHVGGPGLLEVDATDEHADLTLHLEIELEVGGLVRLRATVTNTGSDVFTVDALTLALPLPGRPRRAARLRWPVGARTRPAAADAAHRHPLAREPPGPHGRGQCARAARGHTGFRLRQRRHPRRPHGVERQPRPLRGADLHRRDRDRWRRAPAARRGADRHGGVVLQPVGLLLVRRRARRGRPAVPPPPAGQVSPGVDDSSGHAQRVGGRLLRPPARAPGRPRRARGPGRRRALRAG